MTKRKEFFDKMEECMTNYMEVDMQRVALKQSLEVIARSFKITEDGNLEKLKPLTADEVRLLNNGLKYIV